MILKKSLRSKFLTGQATLEYFLIFTVVLLLSLLSVSDFFPAVRDAVQGSSTGQGYAQKAFSAISNADSKRW